MRFADCLFIALICGVIYGALYLTDRMKHKSKENE